MGWRCSGCEDFRASSLTTLKFIGVKGGMAGPTTSQTSGHLFSVREAKGACVFREPQVMRNSVRQEPCMSSVPPVCPGAGAVLGAQSAFHKDLPNKRKKE